MVLAFFFQRRTARTYSNWWTSDCLQWSALSMPQVLSFRREVGWGSGCRPWDCQSALCNCRIKIFNPLWSEWFHYLQVDEPRRDSSPSRSDASSNAKCEFLFPHINFLYLSPLSRILNTSFFQLFLAWNQDFWTRKDRNPWNKKDPQNLL